MRKVILSILFFSLFYSCLQKQESDLNQNNDKNIVIPTNKIILWNGNNFEGWLKYLSDENANVDEVWTNKEGLIECSGNPMGYLRTTTKYKNYKLTVTWRWPEEPGNSGVLLHIQLPDTVWPKCIEAQLKSENAGDFHVIGGTDFSERLDKSSSRVEKKEESSENPPGEWNKYEIICEENTITLYVNGVFQNQATNCSVESGEIGFQSEGKPIQFKEIYLEPID